MVPQEPFVFADTVRANVCFGKPEATAEEMVRATRTAHLLDEILALPHHFDTVIGERGVTLSGGQKQRMTLARALLPAAPLLILDDCLSSVDVETEVTIMGNLKHHLLGRTVLMASHRLEPMRAADVIFVLDDGRLCEQGSHEELVARQGLYAKMYRRQQLEAELQRQVETGG
jgi:ABC-type multidrug transport system fused ATPase/permease subunit